MTDYAVIIAARMSSERLPGKALADYGAGPNLAQIVTRWKRSHRNPAVIVATSTDLADDPIANLCCTIGAQYYRGSLGDVVGRMDGALRLHAPAARYVARALADNPLVDTWLADWRLDVLTETGADGIWYGGDHERITYCGTTDVWGRAAWDRIVAESSGSQREHAGAHFWDNLNAYSVVQVPLPPREFVTPIRTELDTQADLDMLRAVWQAWGKPTDPVVPAAWALRWLAAHPSAAVNSGVPLKSMTRPAWGREKPWVCESCEGRIGGIVQGDLRVRCARCGTPRKFYSAKPGRRIGPSSTRE